MEVRYECGQRVVKRYGEIDLTVEDTDRLVSHETIRDGGIAGGIIITGGLGGLGLQSAKLLARMGAKYIYLVSRSGIVSHTGQCLEEDLDWLLTESGAFVRVMKCDVSDEESVVELLRSVREEAGGIAGIIHSAGVIRDALIRGGGAAAGCEDVWNAKALSAWWLHKHTLEDDMEFFVAFSSITSAIGNIGQSAYGAANRFLDELMSIRHELGRCGLSIRWPAVRSVGMAAGLLSAGAEEDIAIDPEYVTNCLAMGVNGSMSPGVLTLLPVGVHSYFNDQIVHQFSSVGCITRMFTRYDSETYHYKLVDVMIAVHDAVLKCLAISSENLSDEVRLIDLGLDSIAATDLSGLLSKQFNMKLHSVEVIRLGTIVSIATHIHQKVSYDSKDDNALTGDSPIITEDLTKLSNPLFTVHRHRGHPAPRFRLLIFPGMGQPADKWYDFEIRMSAVQAEVAIMTLPGTGVSPMSPE